MVSVRSATSVAQLGVEVDDGLGRGAQHGVAEQPDRSGGHAAISLGSAGQPRACGSSCTRTGSALRALRTACTGGQRGAPAGARRPGRPAHEQALAVPVPGTGPSSSGGGSEHARVVGQPAARNSASAAAGPSTAAIRLAGGKPSSRGRPARGRPRRPGPSGPAPAPPGSAGVGDHDHLAAVAAGRASAAAFSQRRSVSSAGPQVGPAEQRPASPAAAPRRSRPRRPARRPGWRPPAPAPAGAVASTSSRPEVRTGAPGNARPSSSAVRRAPTTTARSAPPSQCGQRERRRRPRRTSGRRRPAPAGRPRAERAGAVPAAGRGPARGRRPAPARSPRRGTWTSTGAPAASASRAAPKASAGQPGGVRAAGSRASSESSPSACDPRGARPQHRPVGDQLVRPAGLDQQRRLGGPGVPADQRRGAGQVRPLHQHVAGVRVGRARLGVQVVAVVPDHHQAEVGAPGRTSPPGCRAPPGPSPRRAAQERAGSAGPGAESARSTATDVRGSRRQRRGQPVEVPGVGDDDQRAPAAGQRGPAPLGEPGRPVLARAAPTRPPAAAGPPRAPAAAPARPGSAAEAGRVGRGRAARAGSAAAARLRPGRAGAAGPAAARRPERPGVPVGDRPGQRGDLGGQHRLGGRPAPPAAPAAPGWSVPSTRSSTTRRPAGRRTAPGPGSRRRPRRQRRRARRSRRAGPGAPAATSTATRATGRRAAGHPGRLASAPTAGRAACGRRGATRELRPRRPCAARRRGRCAPRAGPAARGRSGRRRRSAGRSGAAGPGRG